MFTDQESIKEFIGTIKVPPIGEGDLFNGDHIAHINGKAATPKLTGYAVAKWIHLPPWFSTTFPWFKEAFEKNIISFGGLSDIALNMIEFNMGGFSGQPTNIAGSIQKANNEFTVGFKEMARDPFAKAYEFWIRMIRDPQTNICQYSNIDWGNGTSYEPAEENHTGALLFVVLRPDVINLDPGTPIEKSSVHRAYLWTNVKPNNILLASDAFTAGTVDQVESEQAFTGDFHWNHKIDASAAQYLADHSLIRDIRAGRATIDPANFTIGRPTDSAAVGG